MPTHIKALVSWQVGTGQPRDAHMITPSFRHQTDLLDFDVGWQGLADDLHAAVKGWTTFAGNRSLTVKLYRIGGAKPNRPQAIKSDNVAIFPEVSMPRELAVCLSFYGGQNRADQRGRLYVPAWVCTTAAPQVRPHSAYTDVVKALPPLLAALGGVNVDWGVWSPTRNAFTRAEKWYVDDEWDVQRRRGLVPTTRALVSTSG